MLLTVLLLVMGLVPSMAEAPVEAETLMGDWYARWNGLPLQLTFSEDGTYAMLVPGRPESSHQGQWTMNDGYVYLDNNQDVPFVFNGNVVLLDAMQLFFYREPVTGYTPSELITEAKLADLAGVWVVQYVMTDRGVLPAALMKEDTRIYIEESRAGFLGRRFGELILDCTFENGQMSCETEGIRISMGLQMDSMLRMTLTEGDRETQLILTNQYAPAALE